jgi:hypothetical protein
MYETIAFILAVTNTATLRSFELTNLMNLKSVLIENVQRNIIPNYTVRLLIKFNATVTSWLQE